MTIALWQRPLARVVQGIVKAGNGCWLDPSDMSTMFQDAAGTVPVTAVEQPVGLILDKSQGLMLGAELVTNGTFDTDISGWGSYYTGSSSVEFDSGRLKLTRTAVTPSWVNATQTITNLKVGNKYKVTCNIINPLGVVAYTGIRGLPSSKQTIISEMLSVIFTATDTSHIVEVVIQQNSGTVGQYIYVDNISVRELYGNHATQSVTASRPTLSARYNLLTYSEQLDNSAWTKANLTNSTYPPVVTPNAIVDHTGATTADLVTPANIADSSFIEIYQNGTIISGLTYHQYYCVKPNGWRYLQSVGNWGVFGDGYVNFDLVTGTVTASVPDTGIFSGDITPLTDGWFLIHVSATAIASGTSHLSINFIDGPDASRGDPATGNGIDGVYVTRADLRVGGARTTYQRVNTPTDYDTDPRYFPKYLRFDGVDDYMNLPYMGLYANGSASVIIAMDESKQTTNKFIVNESSTISENPKYFPIRQTSGVGNITSYISDDTSNTVLLTTGLPFSADTKIIRSVIDSGSNIKQIKNNSQQTSDNYTRSWSLTLNKTTIGSLVSIVTSNFIAANLYGLIITKSALTDAQRVKCERFLAQKAGVML